MRESKDDHPNPVNVPSGQRALRVGAITFLLATVGAATWSFYGGGIVSVLLDQTMPSETKVDALQAFFTAWGPAAPLAYVVIVTIEVIVAPIPGAILYLPGGIIFGGLLGGTLSLLGNVIGAGIACQLMRCIVGQRIGESFFSSAKLRQASETIERHGLAIIVLLRINPLTSSDLVSYAAGLTQIRVSTVMVGTTIGMAPLCFAQSYFSATLFRSYPWLIWALAAGVAVYVLAIFLTIWRWKRAGRETPSASGTPD